MSESDTMADVEAEMRALRGPDGEVSEKNKEEYLRLANFLNACPRDAVEQIERLRAENARLRAGPPAAPMQLINDCGLNPFAVALLVESFEKHPHPEPVIFRYRGTLISLRPAADVADKPRLPPMQTETIGYRVGVHDEKDSDSQKGGG